MHIGGIGFGGVEHLAVGPAGGVVEVDFLVARKGGLRGGRALLHVIPARFGHGPVGVNIGLHALEIAAQRVLFPLLDVRNGLVYMNLIDGVRAGGVLAVGLCAVVAGIGKEPAWDGHRYRSAHLHAGKDVVEPGEEEVLAAVPDLGRIVVTPVVSAHLPGERFVGGALHVAVEVADGVVYQHAGDVVSVTQRGAGTRGLRKDAGAQFRACGVGIMGGHPAFKIKIGRCVGLFRRRF